MPKDIFEMVFHARAGQGAKSAAELIAEAALDEGKYVQAFPEYGPERSGAPMKAYLRVSKKPIKTYAAIENPDVVAVIDEMILSREFSEGCGKDCVILVNTNDSPLDVKKAFGLKGKVYAVDATGIALEVIGADFPNTAMIGALLKVTDIVTVKALSDRIKRFFLARQKGDKVQVNINAVKRGYLGVRE